MRKKLTHLTIPSKQASLTKIFPRSGTTLGAMLLGFSLSPLMLAQEDGSVPDDPQQTSEEVKVADRQDDAEDQATVAEEPSASNENSDDQTTAQEESNAADSGKEDSAEEMHGEAPGNVSNELIDLLREIRTSLADESVSRSDIETMVNNALEIAIETETNRIQDENQSQNEQAIQSIESDLTSIISTPDQIDALNGLIEDTENSLMDRVYGIDVANEIRQTLLNSKRAIRSVIRDTYENDLVKEALQEADIDGELNSLFDAIRPHVFVAELVANTDQSVSERLSGLDLSNIQSQQNQLLESISGLLRDGQLPQDEKLSQINARCEEAEQAILSMIDDLKSSVHECDVTQNLRDEFGNYFESLQGSIRNAQVAIKVELAISNARIKYLQENASNNQENQEGDQEAVANDVDWEQLGQVANHVREILSETDSQLSEIVNNTLANITLNDLVEDLENQLEEFKNESQFDTEVQQRLSENE